MQVATAAPRFRSHPLFASHASPCLSLSLASTHTSTPPDRNAAVMRRADSASCGAGREKWNAKNESGRSMFAAKDVATNRAESTYGQCVSDPLCFNNYPGFYPNHGRLASGTNFERPDPVRPGLHDNVGVHSPTEFLARFARDAGKGTAGSGRGKNVVL